MAILLKVSREEIEVSLDLQANQLISTIQKCREAIEFAGRQHLKQMLGELHYMDANRNASHARKSLPEHTKKLSRLQFIRSHLSDDNMLTFEECCELGLYCEPEEFFK